jgi:hypothetical protein
VVGQRPLAVGQTVRRRRPRGLPAEVRGREAGCGGGVVPPEVSPVGEDGYVLVRRLAHTFSPSTLLIGDIPLAGVRGSVRQAGVLVGAARFLEVVGHAGRNRPARDFVAVLARKANNGEVARVRTERLEELDAALGDHLVVAADAVDVVRLEVG